MSREELDLLLEEQGNGHGVYADLYGDSSCLDGWFSAESLRRIADFMDGLAKDKQGRT